MPDRRGQLGGQTWLDRLLRDRNLSLKTEIVPGFDFGQFRRLLTPPPAPAGARWLPSVRIGHGGARELAMSIYARQQGSRAPGIVFVHGGGWRDGHRSMLVWMAREMAALGFVTATAEYRQSQEAQWPAALEDVKFAVRWFRANASRFGLEPDRVGIVGVSAGAHLAAMVALTPGRFEGASGLATVASNVQAAVLGDPMLDLRSKSTSKEAAELVKAFLSDERAVAEASPLSYDPAGCPPMLLRVGGQDAVAPLHIAQRFSERLVGAGVRARLEVVEAAPHGVHLVDQDGFIESMRVFLSEHL